jgi:hypothetical protein
MNWETLTPTSRWLKAIATDETLLQVVFASNWNEENLHVTLGISSDDLATFAAVYTINLTDIGEQLPNEVEPSTASVDTDSSLSCPLYLNPPHDEASVHARPATHARDAVRNTCTRANS